MDSRSLKPRQVLRFPTHSNHITEVRVSHDGKKAAAFHVRRYETADGPTDSRVVFYDIQQGKELASIVLSDEVCPAFSPGLDRFISEDGILREFGKAGPQGEFPVDPASLDRALWSRNGDTFCQSVFSDGNLLHKIWDVSSRALSGETASPVTAVQVERDLRSLAWQDPGGAHVIVDIPSGAIRYPEIPESAAPLYSEDMRYAVWMDDRLERVGLWMSHPGKSKIGEIPLPTFSAPPVNVQLATAGNRAFASLLIETAETFVVYLDLATQTVRDVVRLGERSGIDNAPLLEPNPQGTWLAVQRPFSPVLLRTDGALVLVPEFPQDAVGFTMEVGWDPHWIEDGDAYWISSHPTTVAEQRRREFDVLVVFKVSGPSEPHE
jgi:hypothetical protein